MEKGRIVLEDASASLAASPQSLADLLGV
jgi:hypothetical protein